MIGIKMVASLLVGVLLCATTTLAQSSELPRNEVGVQGIGFFTKDSDRNGVTQHTTDSGGFLISYRNHFNNWLGADLSYGYTRNTQQNFRPFGAFNVQSNVHETTAALVVNSPGGIVGLKPFALAGAGALTFNPTNNVGGAVLGADVHARPAFVYGGGADFGLNDHFAIRLEYRGLVYKRPDFGLGLLDSNATTHTAQPSAGIVIRF